MKKRFFAVLITICLILGTCVLFASAATINYKVGDYLIGSDDSLKVAKEGTDYNIPLTISAKSDATLPLGTTYLSASNIDAVFTFKAGAKNVKYSGTLDKYITIDASVNYDGTTVTINDVSQKSVGRAYVVETSFDGESPVAYSNCKDYLEDRKVEYTLYDDDDVYALRGTTTSVRIKAVMCSLTTGIQLHGSTSDATLSEEEIFIRVQRYNDGYTDYYVSEERTIDGIMTGDQVYLSANSSQQTNTPYEFYCWINELGDVLSTSPVIMWLAGTNQYNYIYAVFIENSNYFAIDAPSSSLNYKETMKLSTKGAHESDIEWTSSDNNVLTVKNGVVTAVGKGTATITGLASGRTSSVTITVGYSWWQWIIVIMLFGWIWY